MDTMAKREYLRLLALRGAARVHRHVARGRNQHVSWFTFADGSRLVAWDNLDGSPRALQHDTGPGTPGAVGMCKHGRMIAAANA